jgi:hypothetical protein
MVTNPGTPTSGGAPQVPEEATPSFGLDYIVSLNRPTIEAMTAINKRFLDQLATFNNECASFAQTRFAEDVELAQHLTECRSPQDVFRVYSQFAQNAVQQYQTELARMTRMGQEFGTEAAEIMREKVEEARRPHTA